MEELERRRRPADQTPRVEAQPVADDRRVDTAKVDAEGQVSRIRLRQIWNRPVETTRDLGASDEKHTRSAMVCPRAGVLLHPSPELRVGHDCQAVVDPMAARVLQESVQPSRQTRLAP